MHHIYEREAKHADMQIEANAYSVNQSDRVTSSVYNAKVGHRLKTRTSTHQQNIQVVE